MGSECAGRSEDWLIGIKAGFPNAEIEIGNRQDQIFKEWGPLQSKRRSVASITVVGLFDILSELSLFLSGPRRGFDAPINRNEISFV